MAAFDGTIRQVEHRVPAFERLHARMCIDCPQVSLLIFLSTELSSPAAERPQYNFDTRCEESLDLADGHPIRDNIARAVGVDQVAELATLSRASDYRRHFVGNRQVVPVGSVHGSSR